MDIILKITGSILILISSSAAGFYFSRLNNYRIKALLEFKKAILMLRSEIEFSADPLPAAMELIAERAGESFSEFFKAAAKRLNEKKGDGISEIWKEAIESGLNKTYLAAEDIEYFKALGNTLGQMDRSLQINNLQMNIEYIDTKMDYLYNISGKNRKMYASLGILCGLLIVVILI